MKKAYSTVELAKASLWLHIREVREWEKGKSE